MFRMYRDYCKNYNESLETLKILEANQNWTEYVKFVNQRVAEKEKVTQESSNFMLSSLLIMPVQVLFRKNPLIQLENSKVFSSSARG